ncbi:putative diacylglycerol kinase [Porphyridium purpureum]|uniref:Diacylglycerol kinase n=1 Tax=Porphyridium purpureum TaxID=35688 RepID=A0A5J4Z0R0_PORPP|nr:putative diacylglycerol kinase [Porphyridium purpureum]|eukprot:POR0090..scf208_2
MSKVIAFVNSVSGGQRGSEAFDILVSALGQDLVFDLKADKGPLRGLSLHAPRQQDTVESPTGAKGSGAKCPEVRALVCGGDGTFNWVSSVVFKNAFDVALVPVPLGTGNDLARALGWGFKYPGPERLRVLINTARDETHISWIDLWTIHVQKSEDEFLKDDTLNKGVHVVPAAPTSQASFANSGKKQSKRSETKSEAGMLTPLRETFCNYLSFGVDALIELKFNEGRWKNPDKYKSQGMNMVMHGVHGVKHMALESKVALRKCLKYLKVDGHAVDIPSNIQALLFLNITSYGAGSNPWGRSEKEKGSAVVNDGILEIVGLRSLSHFISLKLGINGVRIGQGSDIEMRIETNASHPIPMQADGEPWAQKGCILRMSHGMHVPTFIGPWHDEAAKTSVRFADESEFKPKPSLNLRNVDVTALQAEITQNYMKSGAAMHESPSASAAATKKKNMHRRAKSREAEDLPDVEVLQKAMLETISTEQVDASRRDSM